MVLFFTRGLKLLSLNIERDNNIPKVISLLDKEKPEEKAEIEKL